MATSSEGEDPLAIQPVPTEEKAESSTSAITDESRGDADTCRICRGEGTEEEPLFYPCKCSGSIKYVHQDCLMEWLSHTNKKHCELCKTPFRFTKLYDSHMPETLPLGIFLQRGLLHILDNMLTWLRGFAVALIWLIVLPWCIRWAWRGLFFMVDGGWAREPWIAKVRREATEGQSTDSFTQLLSVFSNSTAPAPVSPKIPEPLTFRFTKATWDLFASTWRNTSHESIHTAGAANLAAQAASSLLSDVDYLTGVTSSPSVNRMILDILEGQVITFLVVIAFILVFLIREWVVQQQPILNAAAHVREAEQQLHRADQARRQLGVNLQDARNDVDRLDRLVQGMEERQRNGTDNETEANVPGQDGQEPDSPGGEHDAQDETQSNSTTDLVPLFDDEYGRRLDARRQTSTASFRSATAGHDDEHGTSQAIGPSPVHIPGHSDRLIGTGGHDIGSIQSAGSSSDSWQDVNSTQESVSPNEGNAMANLTSSPTVSESHSNSSERSAIHGSHDSAGEEGQPSSPSDPGDFDTLELPRPMITHEEDAANNGHADTQAPRGPIAQAARDLNHPKNPLERLFDWFWADIDESTDQAPLPPILDDQAEDQPADVAAFVRFHDPRPLDDQPEEPPIEAQAAEPHIAAVAAEGDPGAAWEGAEGVEDAEDLEGILELIGMQGPILNLVQTAMFCALLITLTIYIAIAFPYLTGKLALCFIGNPVSLFVVMPLQLAACIGDLALDVATLLSGGLLYEVLRGIGVVVESTFTDKGPSQALSYIKSAADLARGVLESAAGRLSTVFSVDTPRSAGDFSAYLSASIQAHMALHELQAEISSLTESVTSYVTCGWRGLAHVTGESVGQAVKVSIAACGPYIKQQIERITESAHGIMDSGFTMTVGRDTQIDLDPALAYWSATDRALTILLGYGFLAMLGSAYLLRREPIFKHPVLQSVEKQLADVLKQAGGVTKVILIISIEMLLFPLYCGLLLDFALLPLFEGATFESRMAFATKSPFFWIFSRWFLGTCYMFHFALFVGMLRRIMRSGVLYFIRDPDDPTFHPVRDVLERNVTAQLKKIAFSALVYGALVILCLGGVIWSIAHAHNGVFPIRWSSPEPILEFPIDFLFYNFLSPLIFNVVKPAKGLDSIYEWWLRRCARSLRLSHFLFGERHEDEEGYNPAKPWTMLMGSGPAVVSASQSEQPFSTSTTDDPRFQRTGRYVRTPASDQVRVPRGERVFIEVTEQEVRLDNPGQESLLRPPPRVKYCKVYIPPWFGFRIACLLVCVWLLSAVIGSSLTVVPLLVGRMALGRVVPQDVHVSDIYALTTGLYILGSALLIALKTPGSVRFLKHRTSSASVNPFVARLGRGARQAAECVYVYGFAIIAVPTLLALIFQLYLVIPLHTYVSSGVSMPQDTTLTSNLLNSTISSATQQAMNSSAAIDQVSGADSSLAEHTMHILQDWTLGFLYARVVMRLVFVSRDSRAAAVFRHITRRGYLQPDTKVATRAFILPTLLFTAVIVLGPPLVLALFTNPIVRPLLPMDIPSSTRTKLYRYSYLMCASQTLTIWGASEVVRATQRWRVKIKDEVYLLGERLHNFGEKKPPAGSRSVMRTDRPVV